MRQANRKSTTLVALAMLLLTAGSVNAQSYFRNWPKGSSPQEVGKRVAENFAARKLEVGQQLHSSVSGIGRRCLQRDETNR